eukprot:snap_masked-scaffold_7-processed-gene-3.45-mRNA-1 protein AED:1.00 eAED:1.00 QI:0/0/0/0/1/1/3/0/61
MFSSITSISPKASIKGLHCQDFLSQLQKRESKAFLLYLSLSCLVASVSATPDTQLTTLDCF